MLTKKIVGLLLLASLFFMIPAPAPAQIAVGLSIRIGPPALPIYAQPICPGDDYLWTPGYWAYGPDGYFWVPGTWLLAPTPGFLWTPGYWGWGGGFYLWHAGYWGPHVGFYGGINYGFGYGGVGFVGGEWRGGVFHYNTAVTNVNTTIIHNTYVNRTVINNTNVSHVSFNGGAGGISARPTAAEQAAEREQHVAATSAQTQHEQAARSDRSFLASVNHGHPAVAATARPGNFHAERGAAANANRPPSTGGNSHNAVDRADRPPNARSNNASPSNNNRPNTSNSNTKQSNPDRPSNSNNNTGKPNTSHPAQPSHPPSQPKEHEGNPHNGARGR